MSEKIYLKIDQQRCVKKPRVTIGDVMIVYCSDKDMIEKIGHITLVEFTLGKYDRKVLDALDVVGIIGQRLDICAQYHAEVFRQYANDPPQQYLTVI